MAPAIRNDNRIETTAYLGGYTHDNDNELAGIRY
jgi:hypothetical protein